MSFTLETFARVSASYNTGSFPIYTYKSVTDDDGTIRQSDYFASIKRILTVGATIWVQSFRTPPPDNTIVILEVTSLSPTVETFMQIQPLSEVNDPVLAGIHLRSLADPFPQPRSPSALLDMNSLSQGALFPGMTTTQRDAIVDPANGLMIYNTTLNKLNIFEDTTWKVFTTT